MNSKEQYYFHTEIPSTFSRHWFYFKQNRLAFLALIIFILIMLVAIFANFIAPYDPIEQFTDSIHLPPSWYDEGTTQFIFGTDYIGRDIFSRLIYGARLSLFLAAVVVILSASIGIFLGVVSSFASYWLDVLIMRIMDFILAVPSLLLAVVIVAVMGPGLPNAIYAVALVLTPHFVLVTRSAIKQQLQKEYVTAMVLDGASKSRLFVYSILPNILPPIIVQLTFAFSTAILEIAALGFLGLGAQPPRPEWGTILSESHHNIMFAPWSVTIPGLAIFFTLLSVNLLGDGLRDAMDTENK
ncbi:MAG: ABC transporter permease subunit [Enterobacterales bacterium]|nr:ABC transporter permease subunit [Enterobacterales bacterium]